ncbi:hypothetical protein C2S52_001026 [Perilla frutescens var. hirtella]|nr:hypothetical protein C2S51_007446 [Perilla frutescens var. frutescens]KAH6800562.1 hypothetical protein C2S52_001026 [Perilla frutescens var. hirtella]
MRDMPAILAATIAGSDGESAAKWSSIDRETKSTFFNVEDDVAVVSFRRSGDGGGVRESCASGYLVGIRGKKVRLHAPPGMAYSSLSLCLPASAPKAEFLVASSPASTSSTSITNTLSPLPPLNSFPRCRSSVLARGHRRSSIVGMAPEEEKMTRRSPLDFPIEWDRPKPGRRPDIFPQFSPMKTPLPPPMPADPPEEDEEEEEENKEEEEEDPEKENPEKPDQ